MAIVRYTSHFQSKMHLTAWSADAEDAKYTAGNSLKSLMNNVMKHQLHLTSVDIFLYNKPQIFCLVVTKGRWVGGNRGGEVR